MRSAYVNAMRSGQSNLCYFFGKENLTMMDFNDPKEFPVQMLMDFEESHLQDNYIKIVHEDEKFDNVSRVVDGNFYMNENFGLCVITQTEDKNHLKKFVEALPFAKMGKFVINP